MVASGATSAYALLLPGQLAAGSGGPAPEYAQPAYQADVVPARLVGAIDPRRVVPDVSVNADLLATPVLFGVTVDGTYVEGGGGGTSVSSPLFAGLQALTDQAAGGPLGLVNPAIYRLRGSGVLRDITAVPGPVSAARTARPTSSRLARLAQR